MNNYSTRTRSKPSLANSKFCNTIWCQRAYMSPCCFARSKAVSYWDGSTRHALKLSFADPKALESSISWGQQYNPGFTFTASNIGLSSIHMETPLPHTWLWRLFLTKASLSTYSSILKFRTTQHYPGCLVLQSACVKFSSETETFHPVESFLPRNVNT